MDVVPLSPKPDIERYAHDLEAGDVARWRAAIPPPASEFVRDSIERAIAEALRGTGDARTRIAWAHGFDSWEPFARHVAGEDRAFEAAADAVVTGGPVDVALVHARSLRRHHATLLHYVAANGVEDFRQLSPPNAVQIARRLLEAGAEVDALADTYDGGTDQTTMNLLVSSTHPGPLRAPLVEVLLDHGAAINGLDDDGSPLKTAITFGSIEAAATLARRGAPVDDLAAAAALGELDTIEALLARGASLETLNAHGGTVLDSTLWFASNAPLPGVDYPLVIRRLLAAGARPSGRRAG